MHKKYGNSFYYPAFQVNGQTLAGMTHDAAVSVFKNTTGTVNLSIEQDAELTVLSVSLLRIFSSYP